MTKTMTNGELIKAYNGLFAVQKTEEAYRRRTGKPLLGGRIKLTYAVKKNMKTILDKLTPYNESREELIKEYRDQEAEAAWAKDQMERKDGATTETKEIYREGKTKEEFESKQKELLEIEVETDIHTVNMELLDGLDLDSEDLEAFWFMVEE